jgi:diguanylate cyclase (GGDEF)-like protein/PAS domain S-box-containing protein
VGDGDDGAPGDGLARLLAFESLLNRLFSRFVSVAPQDLEPALDHTLAELGRFVGADRSYIIRYDHDDRTTSMTHEWCAPGVPSSFDVEQHLSFDVGARQRDRLMALEVNEIRDVASLAEEWADDRRYLQAQGITAILEVPFTLDGRITGVIGFDCTSGAVPWRPEDVTVLRAVASLLEQVLARSITEAALASTLSQLRTIFDEAPVALLLIAPDGRVLQANHASAVVLGIPVQDLVATTIRDSVHPEDWRANVRTWLGLVEPDGPAGCTSEVRLLTPRGTRWHRVDARASGDAGGPTCATVHLTDIDEARSAASALAASQRRFQTLVDNLPDAVVRFDRRGRIVFANSSASRLRDRLVGLGEPLVHGWPQPPAEALPTVQHLMRAAFVDGESHTVEFPVGPPPDQLWHEYVFVPEIGADGTVDSVLVVARDITDRRRQEEELAHQATHDTLTGLPNRSLFMALLEQAGEALERRPGSVGVLFFDLDRFKVVNDSLGHLAGDELLRHAADRLRHALRPGDVLARLGGDEFTVLLTDVDEASAVEIAERLQVALAPPVVLDGKEFGVSASIGIVVTSSPLPPTELLRRADAAMYRAKELGRNRTCTFDEDLLTDAFERLELEQELRTAIESGQLRVHYQPEVDTLTGGLTGAEALVRWDHPARGLLPAGAFVPAAEENGLVVPLGSWVLEDACRTAAGWCERELLPEQFVVRVNLSARQLDRPGLAAEVVDVLRRTGLPPGRLCLEVTETSLMRDAAQGLAALTELHAVGVMLAIDDFGTGYSSLGFLKRFPLDVLKIDRSFVDGLPDDADDVAIVTTILGLARSLGLTVTAEGVETEQQRRALVDLGCRYAQGYLFARPMPADGLEELLVAAVDDPPVRAASGPAGR